MDARQLRDLPDFDLVVVDEAAQALEPACWSALLRGKRGLLAGDHLQLPPTVVSEAAAAAGLAATLFERLQGMAPKGPRSVMLTQQYRMHTDIMDWCSVALYGGRLVAAPAVAAHTLADLPGEGGDAVAGGKIRMGKEGALAGWGLCVWYDSGGRHSLGALIQGVLATSHRIGG